MKVTAKSVKGRRSSNQDRVYHAVHRSSFILAVADGMGGTGGGEVAGQAAADACETVFKQFCKTAGADLKKTLNEIYRMAQQNIASLIADRPELSEMGTTLTVVLGRNQKYAAGNIGDSRAYLVTQKGLHQITRDHSYVQEYIDQHPHEKIDPDIERKMGHILTLSLGKKAEQPDLYPRNKPFYTLKNGDCFLLASDGLDFKADWFAVAVEQQLLQPTPERFAQNLVRLAYQQGSADNISLVVGAWPDWKPARKEKKSGSHVIAAAVFSVAAVIMLALFLIQLHASKDNGKKNPPTPKVEISFDQDVRKEPPTFNLSKPEQLPFLIKVENDSVQTLKLYYRLKSGDQFDSVKLDPDSKVTAFSPVEKIPAAKNGENYEIYLKAESHSGKTDATGHAYIQFVGNRSPYKQRENR